MNDLKIVTGVGCGIAAGALWGLVFVAPELTRDFNALSLVVARYLCYGLFAVILIGNRWQSLATQLNRREWINLAWLSLLGNTVYYLFLTQAVHMGGVAMASLVIGFLPVTVTFFSRQGQNAVPVRRLLPSLCLSVAGTACIGLESVGKAMTSGGLIEITALLYAVCALFVWTGFAIGNGRALSRLERISASDWSMLIGVMTGIQGALLAPFVLMSETTAHSGDAWLRFAGVAAAAGLLSSVVGNALWNQMNRMLPSTMVGQMILFETLFALLYGFLWETRHPTPLEWAAIGLVVASVLSCVAAHRPRREAIRQNA